MNVGCVFHSHNKGVYMHDLYVLTCYYKMEISMWLAWTPTVNAQQDQLLAGCKRVVEVTGEDLFYGSELQMRIIIR